MLCNVVVSFVVPLSVDVAPIAFSVVSANEGAVVVVVVVVELFTDDKLDTSTAAYIITDTCRQIYSYLVNLVFEDIFQPSSYTIRFPYVTIKTLP